MVDKFPLYGGPNFCYATLERTFLPASTKMSKLFLVNRDRVFLESVYLLGLYQVFWILGSVFGF